MGVVVLCGCVMMAFLSRKPIECGDDVMANTQKLSPLSVELLPAIELVG